MQFKKLIIACSTLFTAATGFANVVGVDTQNFNPVTDGLDYVTVHSSKTLEPGIFNFGLFLNYAVNTLPYFDEETSPFKKEKVKDAILGVDANIGYGITKIWSVGLSIPQVAMQSVEETDAYHGQFGQTGITEARLNTKFRLLGRDRGGIAVVGTLNHNLITNNPYAGSNPGPVLTGEMVFDRTFGSVAASLNLGYRSRSPGKALEGVPVAPIKNQYIASVGSSYLIKPISSKVIFEVFGSAPAEKSDAPTDDTKLAERQAASGEALLGLKHDVSNQLALHGGAGTELMHGVSSPDWRLYAGLNYTMGPGHSKAVAKKRKTPRKVAKEKPSLPYEADFQASADVEDSPNPEENPFAGNPPPTGTETFVIQDVHFAFDKENVVLLGSKDILVNLVAYLNKAPLFNELVIEGNTDYMGSDAYNQNLSERRANAIRNYLIKHLRVDGDKIKAMGFGESAPIADNGNFQGRQLNRRVEFTISRGP